MLATQQMREGAHSKCRPSSVGKLLRSSESNGGVTEDTGTARHDDGGLGHVVKMYWYLKIPLQVELPREVSHVWKGVASGSGARLKPPQG